MKFSKIDLLTLLISLFIFASCNKTNTLGLDLDPNDAIQGALVDTLTIHTKTMVDDPASTYGASANSPSLPLGFIKDPIFGTSEASLALSVSVPNNGFSFGTNPIIDSAVLVLPYAPQFYGDTTTSVYSIDVYQLTKNITKEADFLSNKQYDYQSTITGNFTGKLKPNTPVKVTAVLTGAPDTLKTVPASIRIKLDRAFVQEKLANVSSTSLANNAVFNEYFKGLYVSINKAQTTGVGGIMQINLDGKNSSLEIYYRKQNATTATAIDTVASNFTISQSTGPVAASIKHNYEGTAIATQLADASNKQYDVTYLQGLAGLRNKISFPGLQAFVKNVGSKIVINKAELVVDLSTGTDVAPFLPAQRLALYQLDIAGQRALIADQNTKDNRYTGNFGTGFNSVSKSYSFIVTAHMQDLIDGKTKDYGTFLAPTAPSLAQYSINPSITTPNRSVIGSGINSTNKVKLNIYYTKID
ncbi:DUF4270 domain-containing protein [Pedobacter sp.]|uniref:DUF4270 domain-containing protein n=1 Tax=Pedobacter sp. TaxID=1411316 RepID=UPI003D7F522F